MKRLTFFIVVFSLFLVSCASPAKKILSADNTYYYYLDAFNDKNCAKVYNETCAPQEEALNVLWIKLDRAKLALKRGGSLPLQLKDVKQAEKKVKEVNKP